jgi:hypothetical protein
VQNGPALERSLYGSEMAPPPMLLPPVPSQLIGPPKPLPRSLTIPPPSFLMAQKPTAAPPQGAAYPRARRVDLPNDVFDMERTAPLEALPDDSGDDTLVEERELDRIADMTAERIDDEEATHDLPYKPSTFSDVPTRPHGLLEAPGGLRPLESQRPIDTQRLRDDTKRVTTISSAPRPLARTLSIPVTESVRRIALVAVPAAAASLIAVYATLSLLRGNDPVARLNPAPAHHVASAPAARPAAAKHVSVAPLSIPVSAPQAVDNTGAAAQAPRFGHEQSIVEMRGSLRPQLGEGEGLLSLDTRPWSTVYLGKQLLGTTPLIGVVVPKRALLLRLVDGQGHEHMRGIAASEDETRRAFFDFEPASARLSPDADQGPAPAEAAENAHAADKADAPAPAKAGPAAVPSKADDLPMREAPVAIDRLAPVDNTAY